MPFVWKCDKCGYTIKIREREEIHRHIEPKGRCPKCGTPHESFKLLYLNAIP